MKFLVREMGGKGNWRGKEETLLDVYATYLMMCSSPLGRFIKRKDDQYPLFLAPLSLTLGEFDNGGWNVERCQVATGFAFVNRRYLMCRFC